MAPDDEDEEWDDGPVVDHCTACGWSRTASEPPGPCDCPDGPPVLVSLS